MNNTVWTTDNLVAVLGLVTALNLMSCLITWCIMVTIIGNLRDIRDLLHEVVGKIEE